MTVPDLLMLVFLLLLLALSAFFSSSEIAFAGVNRQRLKKAADGGSRTALLARSIADDPDRAVPTILIGNDLVNIAASSAATVLAVSWFGSGGQAIATAVMTLLIITFGEALPKILAADRADSIAVLAARPMRFFMAVFHPVVTAVSALMRRLSRIWTPKESAPSLTSEELCTVVETIEDEGVLTSKESELIKSAIEFTDLTARDILVPRVDVAAFDIDDDPALLLADDDLLSFSRIPVFRESLDNIVGILPTKKLLRAAIESPVIKLDELLLPPVYVHMTRTISSILEEFRSNHIQMAVVVDEFGGTMGILTLEDILEEIVGDIYDEGDDIAPEYSPDGENSYIVDGGMNIHDLFDLFALDPHDFESDYTTVGGFATEMLDKLPDPGDSFDFGQLHFEVLSAQANRVEKLRVTASADGGDETEDNVQE